MEQYVGPGSDNSQRHVYSMFIEEDRFLVFFVSNAGSGAIKSVMGSSLGEEWDDALENYFAGVDRILLGAEEKAMEEKLARNKVDSVALVDPW